jgi:phosphoenolpyruvate-protein phosphotransferase (PTS system enzyme I)
LTRDEGNGKPAAAEGLMRGTPVSPGIGRGTAYVLACGVGAPALRREIAADEVGSELARFDVALDQAERDLLALKKAVDDSIGPSEGDIFAAQALVVRDPILRNQVSTLVREQNINLESAVAEIVQKFTRTFDDIPDPYLRERAADIRDVGRRVLAALVDEQQQLEVPEGAVVVADELLPSVTARLDLGGVRALVSEHGGRFSHASILARSQGTPAVVGISGAPLRIKTGDRLIVDGIAGVVFVNPPRAVEREYERLEADFRTDKDKLRELVDLPAVTADGTAIGLFANASKLADTEAAMLYKADGIGLYRTEFGYAIRSALPTEEEQFEFLEKAATRLHPRRIVFRLLDVGGDKQLSSLPLPASRNPSLAERGIRLLLKHPEILKRQLRAFLRVSATHPISILLPVVGGPEEIRQTRQIIGEVQRELAAAGQAFDPKIPIGAMIEIPAAALIARQLAEEVDFFSLGTNDLVQYVLAADREDETVAPYYQPLHPAVLRLVGSVADVARETGRPLTICGDIAGEPLYTELLLGLGLRGLSVAPGEILTVKNRIRKTSLAEARVFAERALALGSTTEVERLVAERQRAFLASSG